MKTKILLIALLVLAMKANAQTYVSGFINVNTTWNLAGSPYIVNGNALLSHGYTLTINPGVVVKFDSANALQIDGELIAIGTPTNRITFTSNKATPHAGDWASVHFSDTCVSAVFDTSGNYISGCIMKYCNVLYGGGLGSGEIWIESSSPYFSHCNIKNSSVAGIYSVMTSYVIDSSLIKNCTGYGLYYFTYLHNEKILNDSIENNHVGVCFNSNCGDSNIVIKNNYFFSNTGGAISSSGLHYPVISENYFISNSQGAININGLINGSVECNKFINNINGPAITLGGISWFVNDGNIINNVFEGNSNSGGASVALIGCSDENSPVLIFSNNIIRNNISTGNACCEFIPYPSSFFNNQLLEIDHNIFSNNTANRTIYFNGNSIYSETFNFIYLKYNNFNDPGAQYELYNGIPYGATDIYADSNYWGSTSTAYINSVIYDYFDYADYSVVYYPPILNSPVEIDTTCPPSGIITNIISPEITNTLLIYPNPATNNLTIEAPQQSTIEILNIEGELIKTLATTGNKTNVDVSGLSKGMYFVKVKSEKRVAVKKFIKE